ncbi:MAG: hypothetical protein Q8P51_13600 [Ignavibacteria bacterium]|nr:hypothetical protein [Ignavibacteria bacterium]
MKTLSFALMLMAILMVGCSGDENDAVGSTQGPAQPRAGDWKVATRFGEFVFTVNATGTQVTKLVTTFSSYTFGGVTQNGTITTTPSPGWSITTSQFTINKSVNPTGTITMTINGTFAQSGDQASGSWSIKVSGSTDTANWGPVKVGS